MNDRLRRKWGRPDQEDGAKVRVVHVYVPPKKPGRNDPCHCGSGKKYKKCHG